MQALQRIGLECADMPDAGNRGARASHGGVISNALLHGRGANRARIGNRAAFFLDRVDDQRHLAVLDHVNNVKPAFSHLVDDLRIDTVGRQHGCGATRRKQ